MALGDILAKATKAIKTGNEQTEGDAKAIGEKMKGIDDYKKSTAPPAPASKPATAPPSPKDKINAGGQYGDRGAEKRIDTSGMTKPLGSFHKGGKVKKTGMYNLKKGEAVLTKEQQGKVKRSANVLGGGSTENPAAGSSPDDMHISKLDDGSFQMTHSFNSKEPMKPSKKFSAKNAKHLVKHIRAAYNAPAESPEAGAPDGDTQ